MAGCQSYEPLPLDAAVHHSAWRERRLEQASFPEYLESLGRADEDLSEFDPSDGLTLLEGQLVAFVFHPALRVERLRAQQAAAGAQQAGRWIDPSFSMNLLRVTDSIPDPWVIGPGLNFTLPLSGRLGAERKWAEALALVAEGRAGEAAWNLRYTIEQAWFEWSALDLQARETQRFLADLEGFVATATQLAESGELARTEAGLFILEQAHRQALLQGQRGAAAASQQRLRALLGLAPEAPIELIPARLNEQTPLEIDSAELAERNPSLAKLARQYEVAEARLAREIAKQTPDLTLGPQFESEAGQTRVGLFGGIALPIWNANRRAIAVARVGRELARAQFETEYQELVGRLAAATETAAALSEQERVIAASLLPLVERQLADALGRLRLGEGSSLVLLESLGRAYAAKLKWIDTRKNAALARSEIANLCGPQLVETP